MDKFVLCVCTLEMDIPIFFSLKDVLTILYTSILHLSFTPSWIAFIIFPPNLVASSNLGAKKLDVSSNRRLYQPKFPTSTHSLHPLAATTNSTSSGRWTRSDRAAPRAAERRAGERKRYSATPITNRHVFSKGATIKKKMDIPIQSINTGVPATSKCSYGRIPNFAQQSTIAKRLK